MGGPTLIGSTGRPSCMENHLLTSLSTHINEPLPHIYIYAHIASPYHLSYIFNAHLSGSLQGGLPSNKITAIAGESATGKTYFALGMCKQFLDDNPDAAVIYFES